MPSTATLMLVAARARRRPGRWMLASTGVALAAAFAGAVAAEGVIAADKSARAVLAGLSSASRDVRVTWQGPGTSAVARKATGVLRGLGLRRPTEVLELNPVRLSAVVVRPVAIAPLDRWLAPGPRSRLGPCRSRYCPMLLAGGAVSPSTLTAFGVRIAIVGSVRLASSDPLGFSAPTGGGGQQPPLLLTDDIEGLDRLAGLSGVYRTHAWFAALRTGGLHSWQLGPLEARLQRAQSSLLTGNGNFSFAAPFDGIDAARAQARAAPRRLLLVGGGALTALALFIVLTAGGLRRDQRAELERLRIAGARSSQGVMFVVGECAALCGVGLLVGAALAVLAAAVLAWTASVPAGVVLSHSLITASGGLALILGWIAASALLALSLLVASARVSDLLAVAAVAALALALARGSASGDPLPVLLAPLCCLAAGVITFRAAAVLLRSGERLVRGGPVTVRLALVGLARSPESPSLAIAFVAVAVGLGGFALCYRATLVRGAADEAADRVPLDAIVSPGADFTTPLEVAPLARWRAISGGTVLPVRRTEATYVAGGATVTVPALGVPASGLALLHGWRTSDGSAPLSRLDRALVPAGPVRTPGPMLPASAQSLSLRASAVGAAVSVTADLRGPDGDVLHLPLGAASTSPTSLRARLPPGAWELEAFELDEPTGLATTNAHQNGESAAPATQFESAVNLGPVTVGLSSGSMQIPLGSWHAVGAASARPRPSASPAAAVRFALSGLPGVLRPPQPSDLHPVPVLVDPQTATAAGLRQRLGLTVDGLPVTARVVGVLRRFPTLPADAGGFVVADEATLASALDAQLPGQGRSDELWIATAHPAGLTASLDSGSFTQLSLSLRQRIESALRGAPIARAVLRTLVAAAALCGCLAVLGLLLAVLGAARDPQIERDLEAQGFGPRGLRQELRLRLVSAAALGVSVGLAVTILLTRLAVAGVRAAGTVADPRPPLVTVIPWAGLVVWGVAALAVLALAAWLSTQWRMGRLR